jgi:acyl dehydratase
MRCASAKPAGFFVLRTPLLPGDALMALSESLELARSEDPARAAEVLAANHRTVRARLRDVISQPVVREAVFLASPSLAASVAIWERDPEGPRGQDIERALYCHVARMAGQPIPIGLFAGSSTGTIATATELTLEGRASYRRHCRLDIEFLVALGELLGRRREFREQLSYRVNSSLYRAAGRIHLAAQVRAGTRAYRLVAFEITPYLDATLQRAADGGSLITSIGVGQRSVWLHGGTGDRQISLEGYAYFPSMSADGQKICFRVTRGAGTGQSPSELWVADIKSGQTQRLFPGQMITGYDIARDDKVKADNQLTNALAGLKVQVEAYPDLKANQNMMQLSEELTSTENRVAFARQFDPQPFHLDDAKAKGTMFAGLAASGGPGWAGSSRPAVWPGWDGPTAKAVIARAADLGLLLLTCGMNGQVIRWIPPIDVSAAEIGEKKNAMRPVIVSVRASGVPL